MSTPVNSFMLEKDLTLAICNVVNTPRAQTVSMMVQAGEWEQLLSLTCDPRFYQTAGDFADDYLVTKVMSKTQNIKAGWDTRQVAIDSFYESERHCRQTNDRLQSLLDPPRWVRRVRRLVSRVLGPCDESVLENILSRAKHGPGGSVGVRAGGMVGSDKFDCLTSVTEELLPYSGAIMGPTWFDYRPHPVPVVGSEFFTVPKNAKTDRCCAKEPTLNMFLQLGIGSYIASRLKRFGVDIRDQSWNQALASMAHLLGLATLDLSMASDLISTVLIFLLLPRRWQHLLSLCRSRRITMPGQKTPILLEKFCTMGNGFTFALETLIFWAVAKTVSEEGSTVSAYGDDLIVPQRDAERVVDALEFLGFRVNSAKSCLAGRFFESCGTDWFDGINVRPFFLTGADVELHVPYQVTQANALRAWANRRSLGFGCDGRFQEVWESLEKGVPTEWRRCVVPVTAGDVGLVGPQPSGSKRYDPGYQRERFRYRRIRSIPERKEKRTFGVLLAILAGAPSDDPWLGYSSLDAFARASRHDDGSRCDRATLGLEPRRGLYGLSRPGWAWCDTWPDGWDWAN